MYSYSVYALWLHVARMYSCVHSTAAPRALPQTVLLLHRKRKQQQQEHRVSGWIASGSTEACLSVRDWLIYTERWTLIGRERVRSSALQQRVISRFAAAQPLRDANTAVARMRAGKHACCAAFRFAHRVAQASRRIKSA